MSINSVGVLRLGADTKSVGCLDLPDNCGWNEHLADYIDYPGYCEIGDILLVPTYRLEEVEEIIEPEKPGVPVEPYVGLSWEYMGDKRVVIEVSSEWYVVVSQAGGNWYKNFERQPLSFREWANYPRTPSTPAVTRKVKKWVKIEHPEALPND